MILLVDPATGRGQVVPPLSVASAPAGRDLEVVEVAVPSGEIVHRVLLVPGDGEPMALRRRAIEMLHREDRRRDRAAGAVFDLGGESG